MTAFLQRLAAYADISKKIMEGNKVSRADCATAIFEELESLATRMYTGFFMPYEPQALFMQEGWGNEEIHLMGQSIIHPLAKRSCDAANFLNGTMGDFAVYGIDADRRYDVCFEENGYSKKEKCPHVLVKGDFATLAQVTDDLLMRIRHPNPSSLPPIIIQDKEFWGSLFQDESFDYSSLGIVFTADEDETKVALSKCVTDKNVHTNFHPEREYTGEIVNVFATTDHIKFDQQLAAQVGYKGKTEIAHGVVGPYQIPEEKTNSYTGNALEKLRNIMEISLERGLKDTAQHRHNLVVHDGGLAIYLMNEKGERSTEIFIDKEFFPYSAGVMNRILSGPGVELAELYKSAPNLDVVIKAVFEKVDVICKNDSRFKPTDIRVTDTVVQMAIPLEELQARYETYSAHFPAKSRRELCQMIAHRHASQVFDAVNLKLLREPQYDSAPLSTDTTHFLTYGKGGQSRAESPAWIVDCPTVTTFQMLMRQFGIQPDEKPAENVFYLSQPIKIAFPQMLFGNVMSVDGATNALKKILSDKYKINWNKGPRFWRDFVSAASGVSASDDFKQAASLHRKNIRDILDKHDFLYIPSKFDPKTPEQWLQSMLLMVSAMVQRQVFKPEAPRIVLERGKFADEVIAMFKSLKNMGLVGQQFDHLVKLSDSLEDSAHYISEMSRIISHKMVDHKHAVSPAEIPPLNNLTAVVYCSASNKNGEWVPDAVQVGRELARRNIDLKLGGGKDGMMQAVADGYLEGLAERDVRGDTPTCKLHLIQCTATQTIEGDYVLPEQYAHLVNYIERRCHGSIEERRFDLQQSHIPLGLAGGLGSFEEFDCELIAEMYGEKDSEDFELHLLSQSGRQPNGSVASVYDYFDKFMRNIGLPHGRIKICHSINEIIKAIDKKQQNFSCSVIHTSAQPIPQSLEPKVA